MTTADLILQTMMHDFREHMYSKIEEVLKINIVCFFYIMKN